MPRLPVKKIRKQMKLLLLLLLLSCAAWLTYVHLGLVRQGRALRQRLGYGRGTARGARAAGAPGRGPSLPPHGGLCWARPARRPRPLFPALRFVRRGRGSARPGRWMTSAVTRATLFGRDPGLDLVVSG